MNKASPPQAKKANQQQAFAKKDAQNTKRSHSSSKRSSHQAAQTTDGKRWAKPKLKSKSKSSFRRKSMPNKLNVRAVVALTLEQILFKGRALDDALESGYLKVKHRDKGVLHAICYGVLRHHGVLQQQLKSMLDDPQQTIHPRVLMLLEAGLWQLDNHYAEHACVHETVDACEQLGFSKTKGFVNALLRKAQKQNQQHDQQQIDNANNEERLSLLPSWLRELIQGVEFSQNLIINHSTRTTQLKQQLAEQQQPLLENLLQTHTQQPTVTIRLNPKRMSIEQYQQQLKQLKVQAALGQFPNSLVVQKITQVSDLPGYRVGAICVQDEAAQCAGYILHQAKALNADDRFLDACAAPGGKTTHMQEIYDNQLRLFALEVDEFRSRRLRENLGRLRCQGKIILGSALTPDLWWDGRPYEQILLDAPCTGTGVMRRNPDIPWVRNNDDIIRLSYQSLRMLKRLWSCLASHGQLLFATCSVLPEENDLVIEQFLHEFHNAETLDFNIPLDNIKTLFGRQILTSNHNDSLYYCLLQKKPTLG